MTTKRKQLTAVRGVVVALCLLAACMLAVAPAQAHHGAGQGLKLTGGQTTLTLSDAAKSALSGQGITVTPIDPATSPSDGTFVFPIAWGRLNSTSLTGFVANRGGVELKKGDRSLKLRFPTVVDTRAGTFVLTKSWQRWWQGGSRHRGGGHRKARASHFPGRGWHRGWRIAALLSLSNVQRSNQGANVTITGDAALTAKAAKLLNHKLNTNMFSAGASVGAVKVEGTTS